ncbi:MAG: ATP-binding cassette domain-containing protein [Lachnospiraceae bacterium]
MSILEFDHVAFCDGDHTILNQISVAFDENDFVTIVGSSGSGKSTLLRLCCSLITPSRGRILYRGTSVTEYEPVKLRSEIAYSFQNPYLFGETVWDNLIFPFQIHNDSTNPSRILSLLSDFHMSEDYLGRQVTKLSGGEKQRISLIRSLIYTPKILLLDEPTSALDAENTKLIEQVIRGLHQNGMTILWITHNEEQSRRLPGKLLTLESGNVKTMEDKL